MHARISAVSYALPESTLTNAHLAAQFPEWSVDKIAAKTGIRSRRVAGPDEYSSDLGAAAAEKLFAETGTDRATIDYLIVCTQTPDYIMPSTSLLVHNLLNLRHDAGATDITLGCSGYVYALGLAKGLIDSGQVTCVLVVTADTYTRLLNPADKSVRTLFGDGASATLISSDGNPNSLGGFTYGSDGSGGGHLVVPNGGLRAGDRYPLAAADTRGLMSNGYDLFMNGPEIFNFTIRVAPPAVDAILKKAGLNVGDVDLWVFHQANAYMLDHLRLKMEIPEERFVISMAETGNTVSSTIPIALAEAGRSGRLSRGMRVLLLGFGVGLSWGGVLVEW